MQRSLAILLALSAATAQAELKPLEDARLAQIDGQAGVTLNLDLMLKADKIAWIDDGGSLQRRNLTIDNGCDAPGACPAAVAYGPAKLYFASSLAKAPTVQVDIVEQGGKQKLQLTLPDLKGTSDQMIKDGLITEPLTLRMRIAYETGLGDLGKPGSSTLGGTVIQNLSNLSGSIRIWGH